MPLIDCLIVSCLFVCMFVCMTINLCLYKWMGVYTVDDNECFLYGCFLFMVWYVVWCDAL